MSDSLGQSSVLVTGADGFIGSHLAEQLCAKVSKLRVLTQYNSLNSHGWLDHSSLAQDMDIWSGDIRDPSYCRKLLKGVDIVFNLAALIAIPYSYQAPSSYVTTNVIGTTNLLESALENNVKAFYQTSTSEVYGTARSVPISESHPLQPQSPYSASKIASDSVALSFYASFDLPVTIIRPFNTYGPRQSARAIIPTIISQVLSNCTELKLGSLTPTRDFNYVIDTCHGFMEIASEGGLPGEAINIGSGKEVSIGQLTEIILELLNSKHINIVCDEKRMRPTKSEVNRLLADTSKIKLFCNYIPKTSLREGLVKTIEWFNTSGALTKYKANQYNI